MTIINFSYQFLLIRSSYLCNDSFLCFEHLCQPVRLARSVCLLVHFLFRGNLCQDSIILVKMHWKALHLKKKNPLEYFIEHENDLFLESLLSKTALALSPFICTKFTTFFTSTAVIDLLRNYTFFLSQFQKCIFFPEN